MKISELKTGMLVKNSKGDILIVIKGIGSSCYGRKGILLSTSDGCYSGLENFNEDTLENRTNKDIDIIEVREPHYLGDVFRKFGDANSIGRIFFSCSLLWERNDKTKLANELAQQIAKLTKELEAIKEKLQNPLRNWRCYCNEKPR